MAANTIGNMSFACSRTAIVSPSGKLYGSERTLLHFLNSTKKRYTVFVFAGDKGQPFLRLLQDQEKHSVRAFTKCSFLYATIAVRILLGKYRKIYVNEGGHIRYIRLLASFFRRTQFVVHIRLNEDATRERLGRLPENTVLVCTSNYVASQVLRSTGSSTKVVSSPCRGAENDLKWKTKPASPPSLKIGVIGRLADSKGIDKVISFSEFLERNRIQHLQLNFYGSIVESNKIRNFLRRIESFQFADVRIQGFQNDMVAMYSNVDVVLHFNEQEPLGAVFFEALNHCRPFVGFAAGGIGEIADELGILELMIEPDVSDWRQQLLDRIESVYNFLPHYRKAQSQMRFRYSPANYVATIEALISSP